MLLLICLQVLKKNKYLCVDHYYEEYFDFHCSKKLPGNNSEWYIICGTEYKNHWEYIIVVCAFCSLGLFWFWQLLGRSGPQPRTRSARGKYHRDWWAVWSRLYFSPRSLRRSAENIVCMQHILIMKKFLYLL